MLMTLGWNTGAASKGGTGGSTKDYDIYAQIWLDDFNPTPNLDGTLLVNGVTSDDAGPYINGVDRVMALVGADRDIVLQFNYPQFKKPPIRHFHLSGEFPQFLAASEHCWPSGLIPTGERPVLDTEVVPFGFLQIFGNNIDDMPLYAVRHLDARWVFGDNAGRTWTVFYGAWPLYTGSNDSTGFVYAPYGSCLRVERLTTGADKSRWNFSTEGQEIKDPIGNVIAANQHLGYLYYYSSDSTPSLVFAGIVNLPISGTVESLTSEPTPLPSRGYNPGDGSLECPLRLEP
ncbi:MAG: hypothetical protein HY735_09430 [Verrucomicrobia bacterium]|nr:hypothetical protein [Verrucomicrobiota bacterium]